MKETLFQPSTLTLRIGPVSEDDVANGVKERLNQIHMTYNVVFLNGYTASFALPELCQLHNVTQVEVVSES